MSIQLFDTTLRDGTQSEGLSLSVQDKVRIARLLDDFGIHFIEGGYPASNPKDTEFFRILRANPLRRAKLTAFGNTRKAGVPASEDPFLEALLAANTPVVCLVGKSWPLHVTHVLGTTLDENLAMIRDTVHHAKRAGREVVYDAEHFFDGYRADPSYAMATVSAAAEAGADWIALCDTNGGSLPGFVTEVVRVVRRTVGAGVGIHTHNDGDLAVANAVAAIAAGCTMVQGTINGWGERCGNANLVSLIPTLELKMGLRCLPDGRLSDLTDLSRRVSAIAHVRPGSRAAYVGEMAFAHKSPDHLLAQGKLEGSYEHVSPELVGNRRHVVVPPGVDEAGRQIRAHAARTGVAISETLVDEIEAEVARLEAAGYAFDDADGSLELLIRRARRGIVLPFEVLDLLTLSRARPGRDALVEATVKIAAGDRVRHVVAEGQGPVHAIDRALHEALDPIFPLLAQVRLTDFTVRILDPESAAEARTRVFVKASRNGETWTTVGVSVNVIEASAQALIAALLLPLLREQARSAAPEAAAIRSGTPSRALG